MQLRLGGNGKKMTKFIKILYQNIFNCRVLIAVGSIVLGLVIVFGSLFWKKKCKRPVDQNQSVDPDSSEHVFFQTGPLPKPDPNSSVFNNWV